MSDSKIIAWAAYASGAGTATAVCGAYAVLPHDQLVPWLPLAVMVYVQWRCVRYLINQVVR